MTSYTEKIEAMSRGSVVLDENVNFLSDELSKRNIRPITPIPGMTDELLAEKMCIHKILVTANSKDFMELAVEYEIGLIAVESLPKDPKTLAKIVSKTIMDLGLWTRHKPYIVTFRDGVPQIAQLKG